MRINFNTNIIPNISKFPKINYRQYPKISNIHGDTVTFTSSKTAANKSKKDNSINVFTSPQNKNVCDKVYKYAEPARCYLEEILNHYLMPIAEEYPQDSQPFTIITNIKSSKSIKQKIIYKLPGKIEEESHEFAQDAIKELRNVFKCKKGITDSELYNIIINNAEYRTASQEACAYKSALGMLRIIKKALENSGAMYFDTDEKKLNKELKAIAKQLSLNPSKLTEDNYEILGCSDAGTRVKKFVHDIVRGRIVLNSKDNILTDKILNALHKMVNDGNIKITSIEYITPDRTKLEKGKTVDDYMPISENKMVNFVLKTVPSGWSKRVSKSGYSAIHINLELSTKIFGSAKGDYNGYSAEIQIMDSNTQELKEIEDLLYKFCDSIPLSDKEYKPMADLFRSKLTPEVKKSFDEYRYDLYLRQMINPLKGKRNTFPSIKEMGYEGLVPPELDFNNLKKYKDKCDEEIRKRKNNEKLIEKYKQKTQEDYSILSVKKIIKDAVSGNVKNLSLSSKIDGASK